jgi:hypothetical protein
VRIGLHVCKKKTVVTPILAYHHGGSLLVVTACGLNVSQGVGVYL